MFTAVFENIFVLLFWTGEFFYWLCYTNCIETRSNCQWTVIDVP